jgi:hypothetical protein
MPVVKKKYFSVFFFLNLLGPMLCALPVMALEDPTKPLYDYGWYVSFFQAKYESRVDPRVRHDGLPSAYIKSLESNSKGWASDNQTFDAKLYRGKRMRFSGMVKTVDAKDWAGLWMRVENEQKVVAFDNMETRPIKGTTDWHPYAVVLDVPKDATTIKLGFTLSGDGEMWAANFSFAPVADNVPVTGTQPEDQATVPKEKETLLPQPENLDFSQRLPAWNVPPALKYWKAEGYRDDFDIAVNASSDYQGHPAITVKSKGDNPKATVEITQRNIAADAFRSSRTRFSCAIKTDDLFPGAGLYYGASGPPGPEHAVAYDTMFPRMVSGTTEWRRYSCVLDFPANTAEFGFGLFVKGVGSASFADAQFERVGEDVPVTGWKRISPPDTRKMEAYRSKPHYLDFEHE